MEELLCLKWKKFELNFQTNLSKYRLKESLCDVTIVCQEKYFPAHKLVLSLSSDYFDGIFSQAKCKHPFIIVKDISSCYMQYLLQFMYEGTVRVPSDSLEILLNAAESLKIKGLSTQEISLLEDTLYQSIPSTRFDSSSPEVDPLNPEIEEIPAELLLLRPLQTLDEDIICNSKNDEIEEGSQSKQKPRSSKFQDSNDNPFFPNEEENAQNSYNNHLSTSNEQGSGTGITIVSCIGNSNLMIESDQIPSMSSTNQVDEMLVVDIKVEPESGTDEYLNSDLSKFPCGSENFINTDNYNAEKSSVENLNVINGPLINSPMVRFPTTTEKSTKGQKKLKNQMSHGSKEFLCKYCPYVAINICFLKTHEKTHSSKISFQCRFCYYRSVKRSNCTQHEKCHTVRNKLCKSINKKKYAKLNRPLLQEEIPKIRVGEKNEDNREIKATDNKANHKIIEPNNILVNYHIYKCKLCTYKSKSKNALRKHAGTHINRKCPECSFETLVLKALKRHIKTKHQLSTRSKVLLPCKYCPFIAHSGAFLVAHEKTHKTSKASFKCQFCYYISVSRSNCNMHEKGHMIKKELDPCNKIKLTNKTIIQKSTHKKKDDVVPESIELKKEKDVPESIEHRKEEDMKVDTDQIDSHEEEAVEYKDNPKIRKINFPVDDQIHKCLFCSYRSKCKKILKSHTKMHTGRNCPKCSFKTNSGKSMRRHIRFSHRNLNDVKQLNCKHCPFIARSKGYLKSHERMHASKKIIFKCQLCYYISVSKSNCDMHEKNHAITKVKSNNEPKPSLLVDNPLIIISTDHKKEDIEKGKEDMKQTTSILLQKEENSSRSLDNLENVQE